MEQGKKICIWQCLKWQRAMGNPDLLLMQGEKQLQLFWRHWL